MLWWAVCWRSFSACRGVGVGQGVLAAGEGARHGSPRVAAGHRASPWDWGGLEGLAGRVSWLAAKKLAVVMLAGEAPSWVWVGRRSARAAAGSQAQTGGTLRLGGPRGAGRPSLVAIHQVRGSHLVGGCPVGAAELGLGGPPVSAGCAGPQAQTGGTVGLGGARGAGLPGLVASRQHLGRHVVVRCLVWRGGAVGGWHCAVGPRGVQGRRGGDPGGRGSVVLGWLGCVWGTFAVFWGGVALGSGLAPWGGLVVSGAVSRARGVARRGFAAV